MFIVFVLDVFLHKKLLCWIKFNNSSNTQENDHNKNEGEGFIRYVLEFKYCLNSFTLQQQLKDGMKASESNVVKCGPQHPTRG